MLLQLLGRILKYIQMTLEQIHHFLSLVAPLLIHTLHRVNEIKIYTSFVINSNSSYLCCRMMHEIGLQDIMSCLGFVIL